MHTAWAQLERNLKCVMPNTTVVIDHKEKADGDVVLMCHSSIRVLEKGVSGRGFASWARVQTLIGIPGVVCLHAPNGLHFTRQAWYGDRFDQFRLDRFYLSRRGEWAYHIREVAHQGAKTLSDHVPVRLELVLKECGAARRPRRSYFKMDCRMLMWSEVLDRVRTIWQEHLTWARDKRKRWTLALGRIRKLLMELRNGKRSWEEDHNHLEVRVDDARRRIHQDHSAVAREEFEEAVTTLRKREQELAEQYRKRCKITWLKEGEAPSKYFFARMKAKNAHKEMTALEGDA
ncbi:hypothetical protein R1sor_006857 [Riccia sorocarpa]|uniref:Endonuclease/exonuclease/phosphatase domain-containing protein n=1 Tax=Riccia sorocarpa TaxID=122646 RepID=A0ABD3HSV6_9MARC